MTKIQSFSKILQGGETECVRVYVSVWRSMPRSWREKVSHDSPSELKVKEIQDAHLELLH